MLRILLVVLSLSAAYGAHAQRPNVVVILADDMGLGDVSAYSPVTGAEEPSVAVRLQARTPRLDRLAREGVRFTNAHTPSSVCTPTRYGLLMGRHPCRSVRGLGVQTQYGDLFLHDRDGRTLADVVREAGYHTAFVGKWHLGYEVFDASGAEIHGAPTDRSLRPDWSRGLRGGPADHGFDDSFGHVARPISRPTNGSRTMAGSNKNRYGPPGPRSSASTSCVRAGATRTGTRGW